MKNELGMQTLGALLSLRPGEVHLHDLRQQTSGDELDVDQSITILALKTNGLPVELTLHWAQKWSTCGWEIQFACPCCREPSRVLRECGGTFCCARCAPRRSAHHQAKNTTYWREGGKTTAAIVQQLTDGSSGRHPQLFRALQRELVRDMMDRTEAVVSLAVAALELTDAAVSDGEHKPKSPPEGPTRGR